MSGDGIAVQTLAAARTDAFCEVIQFVHAMEGGPVDLSSYPTAVMQVRQYQGAPGAAPISLGTVTSENDDGIFVIDAAQGKVQVRISRQVLATMAGLHQPVKGAPQRFFYDILFEAVDGFVWQAAEGEFFLLPGVTIFS